MQNLTPIPSTVGIPTKAELSSESLILHHQSRVCEGPQIKEREEKERERRIRNKIALRTKVQ